MLEDLTADYSALLPQLRDLLSENERLVNTCGRALTHSANKYSRTDDKVAADFGGPSDGISGGDGVSGRYGRVDTSSMGAPYPEVGSLPEVSLGFPFNEVADALRTWTGFDLRGEVTDWIAGDVEGLSTQANAWEQIGDKLGDCEVNSATAPT